MALNNEQYKAFEDILGPENISIDPETLYSYSWRSGLLAGAQKFTPLFEAIVLPGSTAEVQKVVKLCNKLGLQFKASSTGMRCSGPSSMPPAVTLLTADQTTSIMSAGVTGES